MPFAYFYPLPLPKRKSTLLTPCSILAQGSAEISVPAGVVIYYPFNSSYYDSNLGGVAIVNYGTAGAAFNGLLGTSTELSMGPFGPAVISTAQGTLSLTSYIAIFSESQYGYQLPSSWTLSLWFSTILDPGAHEAPLFMAEDGGGNFYSLLG